MPRAKKSGLINMSFDRKYLNNSQRTERGTQQKEGAEVCFLSKYTKEVLYLDRSLHKGTWRANINREEESGLSYFGVWRPSAQLKF